MIVLQHWSQGSVRRQKTEFLKFMNFKFKFVKLPLLPFPIDFHFQSPVKRRQNTQIWWIVLWIVLNSNPNMQIIFKRSSAKMQVWKLYENDTKNPVQVNVISKACNFPEWERSQRKNNCWIEPAVDDGIFRVCNLTFLKRRHLGHSQHFRHSEVTQMGPKMSRRF